MHKKNQLIQQWYREIGEKGKKARWGKMTPEERSAEMGRIRKRGWEKMTQQERSAEMRKRSGWSKMTQQERSVEMRRRASVRKNRKSGMSSSKA